jgi:hypothetical protein
MNATSIKSQQYSLLTNNPGSIEIVLETLKVVENLSVPFMFMCLFQVRFQFGRGQCTDYVPPVVTNITITNLEKRRYCPCYRSF